MHQISRHRQPAESRAWFRPKNLASSMLCVAVLLVCIYLVHPVVELATDDDWSYGKTAFDFARSGHFVYNGWATAMLGWQVVWGALFIKVLGFSFFALRLSTVVTAAASAFLFHRVLLHFGIRSSNAVLGSLTLVLCPLFLPMATSFMTDVPSLLCLLLCVYGCQQALLALKPRTSLLWLCGSAMLNVADGTVRQITWLGALVMIPSAFWLLRRRRGFLQIGIVVWIASAVGIFLCMRWFQHQPYSLPEHVMQGSLRLINVKYIVRALIFAPLDVLLFALPILVAWLPRLRTCHRATKVRMLACAMLLGPLLLWLDRAGKLRPHLPPWAPNLVSKYGVMWSLPEMGAKPEILGTGLLVSISALLGVSLLGWLISLTDKRRDPETSLLDPPVGVTESQMWVLLAPFALVYLALLLPRAAFPQLFSDIYDRYFIPLLMIVVVLLLRGWESQSRRSLPLTCYAVLFLFSLFGVAGTHDTFVGYRATMQAVAELTADHVAPTDISASWQYDGWNQINLAGHINESRLVNPPGSYRPVSHPPLEKCDYWFGPLVPAIHPRFVVVTEPLKCLEASRYPAIPYETWLPPYQRQVLVQHNPEGR
ncbi:MAG: ArnT family glycosyltransferase [Janthinobacterium lividum]